MEAPAGEEQPEAVTAAPAAAAATFKRSKNRGNIRKRPNESEQGAGEEAGAQADADDPTKVVERKPKVPRAGEPLAFASKPAREEGEEHLGSSFQSNRALPTGRDESVFRALETETETDRDARALREAVLQQGKDTAAPVDDGKYRGVNNYIDYRKGFRREHTAAAEKAKGAHGPLRANMYVRMTALMDYNPSICKDYKETGFCSYGDSCKFMHDRGDYKQSWELDRDWEEEQKRKLEEKMRAMERAAAQGSDEEGPEGEPEEEEDDLPFACYICRKPWGEAKHPVVTRCKHYFCEACALKHNAKTGKCAVCEQPTQGIFNVAHDITKKMKKLGKATG